MEYDKTEYYTKTSDCDIIIVLFEVEEYVRPTRRCYDRAICPRDAGEADACQIET